MFSSLLRFRCNSPLVELWALFAYSKEDLVCLVSLVGITVLLFRKDVIVHLLFTIHIRQITKYMFLQTNKRYLGIRIYIVLCTCIVTEKMKHFGLPLDTFLFGILRKCSKIDLYIFGNSIFQVFRICSFAHDTLNTNMRLLFESFKRQ